MYGGNLMKTRDKKRLPKNAHHLWSAYRDDEGRVSVVRSKEEPEEWSDDNIDKEAARETSKAYWGLWGASLVDNEPFFNDIPSGIVDRFNVVAKKALDENKTQRRVYSWKELKTAFGKNVVNEIRESISDGMKIRLASKYLNTPFVITAELIDHLEDLDRKSLKDIVNLVRKGKDKEAIAKFGDSAKTASKIYKYYSKTGRTKLAVDEKAKRYFEDYFGPFGKELTREIKKRVRADLVSSWMRKNGVDESAREYWSSYYSATDYGEEMVKDIAKKLSPAR